MKKWIKSSQKVAKKLIDELREIARLRGIKNREKSTSEDLIITLLKSKSSYTERSFGKIFNDNTDDDTYDDKIRGKISDINIILSRLGNIVTKTDRKKIKKELYEKEEKQNLSDREKEEIYDNLVNLTKIID